MTKTTRLVLVLLCSIGLIYWLALVGLTAGSSERIGWASRFALLAFEIASLPAVIHIGREFHRRFFVDAAALADKDELTGLPNRRHFMERLEAALARSVRSDRLVAVLFLDLDRFKLVNDTLGHSAGDRLLIEAARRFRSQVRSGESIARFGGDEFMILLEGLANIEGAQIAAERMLAASRSAILVNGHEISLSCSIGIALSDGEFCPADELIRRADVALYQAKADGRACSRIFNSQTSAPSIERLDIDAGLRRAIERDELCLYFQPEINLLNGRIEGFEALVRWQHPTRGLLLPASFIEAAEEHGLIHELGKWVLRKACLEAVDWTHYFPGHLPLTISVNLSPFQLRERDLIGDVDDILRETGIANERLKLEIVESSLIQDADAAIRILDGFRRLGVRLAIDDFGTGYSSLSYLRRFPVDTLKIDRSFLNEATADPRLRAIVRAIVTLAHELDIDVTAEGVETREQLSFLVSAGCDWAQGFLFARPLPREALHRFLARQPGEARVEASVAA